MSIYDTNETYFYKKHPASRSINPQRFNTTRGGIVYNIETNQWLTEIFNVGLQERSLKFTDVDPDEFSAVFLTNLNYVNPMLYFHTIALYIYRSMRYQNVFTETRSYFGSNKRKKRMVDEINNFLKSMILFEVDLTNTYVFEHVEGGGPYCYLFDVMDKIDFINPYFVGADIENWEKELNHYWNAVKEKTVLK